MTIKRRTEGGDGRLMMLTPSVGYPKDGYGALICPSHQIEGASHGKLKDAAGSRIRQAERARKRKLKEPVSKKEINWARRAHEARRPRYGRSGSGRRIRESAPPII